MIYFVTEKYLKDNTPIADNVDVKRVTPFVEVASDMRIQPLLGEHFYNDLLTKYNDETLNSDEVTLVKKIQHAVSWYAASEAVFSVSRPLTNKGIQRQEGENSESVDSDELAFGMDHYAQKGAHYIRRIKHFLRENADKFPEFTSDENKDSDLYPKKYSENSEEGFNNSILII